MSAYHPTLFLITILTCLGLAPSAKGRVAIAPPDASVTGQTLAIARTSTPPPDSPDDFTPSFPLSTPSHSSVRIRLSSPETHSFLLADRLSVSATARSTPDHSLLLAQSSSEDTSDGSTSAPKSEKTGLSTKDLIWLLLLGFGTLSFAGIFAGAFYLLTHSGKEEPDSDSAPPDSDSDDEDMPAEFFSPPENKPPMPPTYSDRPPDPVPPTTWDANGSHQPAVGVSDKLPPPPQDTPPPPPPPPRAPSPSPTESLAVPESPPLAKIDNVERSIQQLSHSSPTERRKAIWTLGQQGDTRAVQPLIHLLMNSDSKQRSLILAALSEIGSRTLEPMNRALALSLQDTNPEVRKNAIRDLTRIYHLLSQTSQLLCHAAEDSDAEVQEAAKWALSQLSRIRSVSHTDTRTRLQNWTSPPPDNYPEDIP